MYSRGSLVFARANEVGIKPRLRKLGEGFSTTLSRILLRGSSGGRKRELTMGIRSRRERGKLETLHYAWYKRNI